MFRERPDSSLRRLSDHIHVAYCDGIVTNSTECKLDPGLAGSPDLGLIQARRRDTGHLSHLLAAANFLLWANGKEGYEKFENPA